MKNRIIWIVTIVVLMLTCFVFQYLDDNYNTKRIHQHLEEGSIPKIYIDVDGQDIPGLPAYILKENGHVKVTETDSDTEETVRGSFTYIDDEGRVDTYADYHIRGNSSRYFDKKSYSVHLVDKDGKEQDLGFDGMFADNEWALNGPYLDRTLIRNYMCMNISGEIMEYAPNVRFVELYLDGEFQGLYVLMETINHNKGRLNLTKSSKHALVTSYIVKRDRRKNADLLNTLSKYANKNATSAFQLCYPGEGTVTDRKVSYITQELSRIEKNLYSYDVVRREHDYADYVDINAFARYFIINEFFGNMDAGDYSTYFYKDTRGKLKPCVWDFNNACDNYMDRPNGYTGFHMQYSPWFEKMVEDERFVDEVIYEYRTLREDVLSEAYLQNYITETTEWLGEEIDRNYDVWGDVWDYTDKDAVRKSFNYLTPLERNLRTYNESIEQLRTYITNRGEWLDDNIEILKQYCHNSRIVNDTIQ